MATGGVDNDLNGENCSVCLEALKGRHPKFLHCHHSFCLGCLQGLADREARLAAGADGSGQPPVGITCPSCRKITPIPEGGVAHLQTNYYIDKCSKLQAALPQPALPCYLCDGVRHARYHCYKCQLSFCADCRCYHDKLCQGSQVIQLPDAQPASRVTSSPKGPRGQNMVTSPVSGQLSGQVPSVLGSQSAMTLPWSGQLCSVSEGQGGQDILLPSACSDMVTLWDLYQQLARQVALLQTTNCQLSQHVTLFSEHSSSKIRGLEKEVANLKDHSSQQTAEQATLQKEVSALQVQISRLATDQVTDQAAVQMELQSLRESIAQQDMSLLTSDKDQLCAELTFLQQDVRCLQADISTPTSLRKLEAELATVRADMATVTTDMATVMTDMAAERADMATVTTDMVSAKADIQTLREDSIALKNDISLMKTENSAMKSDISTAETHITTLQGDSSAQKSDMTALQAQVVSLQCRMQSAQDSLRDETSKISTLETCIDKAGKQVAFHADLSQRVRTWTAQTLICDTVLSNLGNGYDAATGEFTAPVAGIYCFMANASPNKCDTDKKSRLAIMLEDEMQEYLLSEGRSWSTCHTVFTVGAGQKVWLRTDSDRENTFSPVWTTFTGFLVQPDLWA